MVDGDGVRELYVGSLAYVGEDTFPASIDYLALGHLHIPQSVGKDKQIHYCGSPLPMGFGEATRNRKVIVVSFAGSTAVVQDLQIPCFQDLERITGSLDDIHAQIDLLKRNDSRAWLEVEYTGNDIINNLSEMIEEAVADSAMEIRRIKNRLIIDRVLGSIQKNETLDDLNENDVFERCMETFEVPDEDRAELLHTYNEILKSLQEEDSNAE
jgi:exonuclease SbcD